LGISKMHPLLRGFPKSWLPRWIVYMENPIKMDGGTPRKPPFVLGWNHGLRHGRRGHYLCHGCEWQVRWSCHKNYQWLLMICWYYIWIYIYTYCYIYI
jgi:hypothetical protein